MVEKPGSQLKTMVMAFPKMNFSPRLNATPLAKFKTWMTCGIYPPWGFRGEALPSIAAISRFTLESRFPKQKGKKLYLEGGSLLNEAVLSSSPLQFAHGTRIVVEDLFYNVPARLKFQKAKATESGQVRELLERIAFSHPHISFTLTSDGRKTLDLKATRDMAARVSDIFETNPEDLEFFESHFEKLHVQGWIDRNARAANSRQVFLSVNQRMVRDKLLHQAVIVGLRSMLMEGEYPKIYLSLEVHPQDIDVNVHPAKSEVRFHKSKDVFQFIQGALERLAQKSPKAFYSTQLSEKPAATFTLMARDSETALPHTQAAPVETQTAAPLFSDRTTQFRSKPNFETWKTTATSANTDTTAPEQRGPNQDSPSFGQANSTPGTAPSASTVTNQPSLPSLHYIGQVKNTYLLFQDSDGLVLIDQHAAHERIRYEEIKKSFFEQGLQPQPLLLSSTVKCKPQDIELALEQRAIFEKLGFEFEPFGETSLILRSLPQNLDQRQASELFMALIEELRDAEGDRLLAEDPTSFSPKLDRILATSACHSSIRAGQALSPKEAQELFVAMENTPSSLNCPHGRPASIKLTFSQIEGLFKR